jgi:hypothetical protein
MDKNIAKELMDIFSALGTPLNKAAELIEQINDEDERKGFRRGIAGIMASTDTDLELPIIRQFPDLDPDKI